MDQSIKKERDLLKYFSQNNEALILEIFKSDQNIRIHQFANAKQFTGKNISYKNSVTFYLFQ